PIDLRIFPKHWVHAFAVSKQDGENTRLSLQFFDSAGEAVHKIHLRPVSNVEASNQFVAEVLSEDQSPNIEIISHSDEPKADLQSVDVSLLREQWAGLTDVHQFIGLLRKHS